MPDERDLDVLFPSVPPESMNIVCFDFDGTLATDTWPSPQCGEPILNGVSMLKHYVKTGYAIVIYSARPKSHESLIWRWLEEHDLRDFVYDVVGGKPRAALYVDDRGYKFSPEASAATQKTKARTLKPYVHEDECHMTKTGYCTCL